MGAADTVTVGATDLMATKQRWKSWFTRPSRKATHWGSLVEFGGLEPVWAW